MIIQNPDGSLVHEPLRNWRLKEQQRYYVEVPTRLLDEQSNLIDWLINVAFDTLGALQLEVRVYEET
jgi:hypothetical protein